MAANKKAVMGLGLLGGAALLLFARKSSASTLARVSEKRKHGIPMQLSKNFRLREFLVSRDPELHKKLQATKLTDTELANLRRLVGGILQPVRDKFGTVVVSNGLRPLNLMNKKGWVKYLKDRGYHTASLSSDHFEGGGADFVLPSATDNQWLQAAQYITKLPATRQVLLYYKTDRKTGEVKPSHIHVGVVRPGKGKFKRKTTYAFMLKDDKRFPGGTETLLRE